MAVADEKFQFPCECGAVLKARRSQVGRKGKCQRCQRVQEIPDPSTVANRFSTAEAVEVQDLCGVCHSAIEADDERTLCGVCDMPFHAECWTENLGCSVYGCENVNVLKQGPDISISATSTTAAGVLSTGLSNNPHTRATPGMLAGRSRPGELPQESLPREYLLLAASSLAALLSVLTCGFPSLITGIMAIVMMLQDKYRNQRKVPIAAAAISVMGILCGFCLSGMYWIVMTGEIP